MELTKDFDPDHYGFALASWTFVDLTGLTPVFASLFGDVFLEAADHSWWYLDRTEGTLRPEWADAKEMVAELETEIGQDMYLLGGVALAAERAGIVPGEAEVYDWLIEPADGGAIDVRNLKVEDFTVALAVAGQIHADLLARGAARTPEEIWQGPGGVAGDAAAAAAGDDEAGDAAARDAEARDAEAGDAGH
jgi:hypothetical protein